MMLIDAMNPILNLKEKFSVTLQTHLKNLGLQSRDPGPFFKTVSLEFRYLQSRTFKFHLENLIKISLFNL